MQGKIDILVVSSENFTNEKRIIESLSRWSEFISKVIVSGEEKDYYENLDFSVEFLGLKTENKAIIRNMLLSHSSQNYGLWISEDCFLEDDALEELLGVFQEQADATFIYPNEVLIFGDEETVRNFYDFKDREKELLQTLAIENMMPEWGVLTDLEFLKERGGFDERFADYEFYDFVYKNIKDLKLKNADFAFIETVLNNTFIDTSYRSLSVRETVNLYDWRKELFPSLSWDKDERLALSTANTLIGDRLFAYFDFLNASEFYRKALGAYENTITLGKLFDAYLLMGLFDEAEKVLAVGFKEEEQEQKKEQLRNVKTIVKNLEQEIEAGKIEEVLEMIPDVFDYYKGAPVHNIMGVIAYHSGDFERAYKFFYKTVGMNPIEENYMLNLTDMAKKLGKENDVIGFVNRIVK